MAARESPLRRVSGFAGLLLAAACASSDGGEALEVGDAAPSRWADDGSGRPLVAWMVRGEDYLGCLTSAGDLRQIQRRHGDRFRLTLLYVGERPEWAAGIVRRERLSARIEHLDAAEFRRAFGGTRLPAFFVVHRGTVTARATSPDGTAPSPEARAVVEKALESALAGDGAAPWSGEPGSNQAKRRIP